MSAAISLSHLNTMNEAHRTGFRYALRTTKKDGQKDFEQKKE